MTIVGPYTVGPSEDDHYGIYTGDARQLLPELPDHSVAFAYADPPYWVDYDYHDGSDADMDYIEPHWLVEELLRISPVVCLSTGIKSFRRYPDPDWLIGWFKPGSTRRSAVLNGFNTWEPILVYGKPSQRVYQDSVYLPDAANHTHDGDFHTCPKPLRLMTWLIENFTEPGDIVLDPVGGSGTLAKAAKQTGRRYLLFEINPYYADQARERVRKTQPPLFASKREPQQLSWALDKGD